MKEAPILRPTWEEFQDFQGYIRKIREENPGAGIVKIVPPADWHPNLKPFDSCDELVIPVPVEQKVVGEKGTYQVINEERPSMSVRDLRLFSQTKAVEIDGLPDDEVERKFWKNLPYSTTMYGADMVRPIRTFDMCESPRRPRRFFPCFFLDPLLLAALKILP